MGMGPYTQHQVNVICLQLFQKLCGCKKEEVLGGCFKIQRLVDPSGVKLHRSKHGGWNPGVPRWRFHQ